MSASTHTLDLPVILPSGPDCERCVTRLRSALERIKGVAGASVDSRTARLHVIFDPNVATLARIEQEAKRIGAEMAAHIDHQTIDLRDLDCPDCASSIEKAVTRLPGVLWAGSNFAAAQIHVEYDRDQVSLRDICKTAEGHGVRACPISLSGAQTADAPAENRLAWWQENRRAASLAVVSLLMLAAWIAPPVGRVPLLAVASVIGGWPTAISGLRALRARALDMNVLMTLAVVGAAAIGDWWEGTSVIALFNLGNLLQAGAMERTRRSIRGLMNLSPKMARVERDGATVAVPIDRVAVGDLVLVKPGERIPVDGEVERGTSTVNESPITGESLPRDKSPGDEVFAGTLNGAAALHLRTTRAARDTTLARILHRVEEAQAQRAPAQQMIDRFARVYTPVVVLIAILVALGPPVLVWVNGSIGQWVDGSPSHWFMKALSLLIIACPCALVISTPVAIVTAIGSASRRGLIIKGGAFLEEVGRMRALLYDKTGTLTLGRFRVDEVIPLNGHTQLRALAIAAAVESHSEHPLAAAFEEANHAANGHKHLLVEGFEALTGLGARARVEGRIYSVGNARMMEALGIPLGDAACIVSEQESRGRTVVVLADDLAPLAVIALADTPRADVATTVREMESLGIAHQAMVTGDNERAAAAIAKSVGLREWSAGLLPERKLEIVREVQSRHGVVGMIGDGINDAPALAAANVGIVMGAAGSDTAMETADIALMGDDLTRLPFLIRLSRRASAIIRQNIAFSLATKLALVVAAVTVGVPLWLAVVGDMGVSLLVTANALRLRF
jgi:Cd2+/Zn2+-exporting ATPase